MEQINDFSKCCLVGNRAVAVPAFRVRKHLQTLEFTVMLVTLKCANHLLYKVVNVKNLQFDTRVIDGNRKVIGDIVAEGSDCTVIVRTAPFAVEIREAVNQDLHPILLSVLKEEVLPCFLASSVLAVAETACERSLSAAGEHHRGLVPVFLEGVKKGAGKTEVALHKVLRVLRTVYTGEIKYEVTFLTPLVKFFRSRIDIVLEDFVYYEVSIAFSLSLFYVIQLCTKILSYEPFSTGYEYPHYLTRFEIPLSSF